MELNKWQNIINVIFIIQAILGVILVGTQYALNYAKDKVASIGKQEILNATKKVDDNVKNLFGEVIAGRESVIKTIIEQASVKIEKAHEYRVKAWTKYQNKEYAESLVLIGQAIAIEPDEPKNFLLRAYSNAGLYEVMDSPGAFPSRKEQALKFHYDPAMLDYIKVIDSTKGINQTLYIVASNEIALLKARRALFSEKKFARTLFEEAKNNIRELLAEFPNDKSIQSFQRLIDDYERISIEIVVGRIP